MHCQKLFLFRAIPFISILAFISSFESLSSQFVAPVFCEMSLPHTDAAVAAAATATPALVRLDAFNEENVEQWFESHRWEFHNNKITKSADKYSLARVKLP